MDNTTEVYGKLVEGIHIAGYTFARACSNLKWLVQEDRWKLDGRFSKPAQFMDSLQLGEFRQTAEERKEIAKFIRQTLPEVSSRDIAKTLGVSHTQIDRDLGTSVPRAEKKRSESNADETPVGTNVPTLTGAAAAKLVERREERKARDAAAADSRLEIVGEGSLECRRGDFRAVLSDLENVDAIITDPPYGKEYLPLLRDLAALADRILKPDGVMAVLYGHTYLPEAFAQMTGFRPYRWTACYLAEGSGYVSQARKVQSKWKPILVYGGNQPRFDDLFRSEGEDGAAKLHHEWGQDLGAFQSIITALTDPGATVVDPFAGGGTTLIAAKSIGRHAIGAEINADAMAFQLEAA